MNANSKRIPIPYADRLTTFRLAMERRTLDAYLVTGRQDQYYLTGFDGEDGAVLVLPRHVYLLTDGRFGEEAARTAPWARAVVRRGALKDALAGVVRRHRLGRVGFDPARITVQTHADFSKAVRPAKLVRASGLCQQQRLIKDDREIASIRKAIDVAESAFTAVLGRLRLPIKERELAAELQHEMIRRGASEASFPIIVAEGPHSSLPHAVPGDRPIRPGSAVLIDWGATVEHYRSDLTRVVFIHRIPARFRRMYASVLAAQAEAVRAIGPGVRMSDVDAAARSSLRRAGLDRQFTHGTGHGIGLDIHEPPRLARNVADRLAPGMVVTVEPGVYCPGVGGVRIEDDILVTATGGEVLTRLPRELDAMVV